MEPERPRGSLPRTGGAENPRVAVISLHTSPLDQPGTGDSGGMNVYIRAVAERLAAQGWRSTSSRDVAAAAFPTWRRSTRARA
jgi:hypothetical protein